MTRKVENPKLITLTDLPDKGKDYDYTHHSRELNNDLTDIIGENPYHVHLELSHLGNAFQATGSIQTSLSRECSRCGADLTLPMELNIQEIIVIHPELSRSSKNSRVNNVSELDSTGPDSISLSQPVLNVGEFVREIVVLNEPFQPLCETPCINPYLAENSKEISISDENLSPFAVLKDLKLNS